MSELTHDDVEMLWRFGEFIKDRMRFGAARYWEGAGPGRRPSVKSEWTKFREQEINALSSTLHSLKQGELFHAHDMPAVPVGQVMPQIELVKLIKSLGYRPFVHGQSVTVTIADRI